MQMRRNGKHAMIIAVFLYQALNSLHLPPQLRIPPLKKGKTMSSCAITCVKDKWQELALKLLLRGTSVLHRLSRILVSSDTCRSSRNLIAQGDTSPHISSEPTRKDARDAYARIRSLGS